MAWRTNDFLMFLLIGLVSIITLVALLQRTADRFLILAAVGLMFFTFAWVAMYFRLKRELPDHALVDATYLNFPIPGQRRTGLRNMIRLIQLHFERHRFDRWSIMLIVGLAMLALSLFGSMR